MLVVFFGKAGVLADHDGLAGVDVPEHPDDENGLAVVTLVEPANTRRSAMSSSPFGDFPTV